MVLALCRTGAADEDGFETGTDTDDANSGPELGVRVGYGVASGRVGDAGELEERIAGALPIGFDLGYRLDEHWFIGGYGEYAIGNPSVTLPGDCDGCTFTWLHLSLSVQYRLVVEPTYDLWVGVGVGRHQLNATLNETIEFHDQPVLVVRTQTFSGLEYFHLHFGANLTLGPGIGMGPYTSVALGGFDQGVEKCDDENFCPYSRRELDLGEGSLHVWFSSGVRVVFLP